MGNNPNTPLLSMWEFLRGISHNYQINPDATSTDLRNFSAFYLACFLPFTDVRNFGPRVNYKASEKVEKNCRSINIALRSV